ncbi:MAG: hypothetical protein ACYTEQ_29495 [Planctomycetota bacterium]
MVATGTILNINETSAALSNNWYIMVVLDIRAAAKQPKTITADDPANYSYPRDFEITYRALLPTISGLQTAYVGKLNSAGVFDLPLSPTGLAGEVGKTISSWLWDNGDWTFEVGTNASQSPTIRFSSAGQFFLRVVVTQSDGLKNYFAMKVFVVPADYSSVINLAFDAAQITNDTANGLSCKINANAVNESDLITSIRRIPDGTFFAIWWDGNLPDSTSDIVFTGRARLENVRNNFDAQGNVILATPLTLEGATAQAMRVISRRLPIIQKTAPSDFGEIKTLTPWRAVVYFLTEHTTIPNVNSISFDDTSDDYQFPRFGTGDSSALAKAWYLTDAARNALTTVADFTLQDMAVDENGGLLFEITRDYTKPIGREVAGGGYYNSSSSDIQVLRALTPSVAQSDGQESATLNRQILLADSTLTEARNELGQRTTDDQEARQPQTVLNVSMPAGYWQLVVPHEALWYTWTIPTSANNKGVAYTTANRWTCRSVSPFYDIKTGKVMIGDD